MSRQPYPSVSVVVATRDRPELLRATLRAVLTQDYPGDVDVIVVYDHSEPEAGLLDDFPGSPIDVITNMRTPGLAGARNSGVLARQPASFIAHQYGEITSGMKTVNVTSPGQIVESDNP